MKKQWLKIRHYLEYLIVLGPYCLLRVLPHSGVKALARFCGAAMAMVPSIRKVCEANIATAFPDYSQKKVARIAKESLFHLMFNLFEFFWMTGRPERVERWTRLGARIDGQLKGHVADGTRVIFVNPHLGSWEASGLMAPYYSGMTLTAVAMPMRNEYLNQLLNSGNREKNAGVHIVFARGAAQASWKALRDGSSLGALIDQNTRVRDGGIFVDFFGLPVPASRLPVTLYRRCLAEGIPAVLTVAATVRRPDGGLQPEFNYLSKPLSEYESDEAVLQELMRMSEELIRAFPEQYLWFYKRFQYIPREADESLAKKYPFYAHRAEERFYFKKRNEKE